MLKKKSFLSTLFFSLIVFFLLANFTGCGKPETNPILTETGVIHKPVVYTSIYPLYDFTQQIGGDKVIVRQLVPSNTEPHDWEPTAKDLISLQKANLFIYNSADMEPWLNKVSSTLKETNCFLVNASSGINLLKWTAEEKTSEKEIREAEHKHKHGLYDPHIWLDPLRAKQQAANIKEALIKTSPRDKEAFTLNYQRFAIALDDLDAQFKDMVKKARHKEFVVVNPAFAYLADRYQLRQITILGLCTEGEPSPRELQKIVDFTRQQQIKYIFFEESYSPKVAQTLAQETKAQTLTLNAIHGLTTEDKKNGKDYIKVMKQNLENLKLGLEVQNDSQRY